MRHALLPLALTCSLLFAAPGAALADVKTQHNDLVKFEGMLGGMMSMFGGDAAKNGVVTTIIVSGDRMMTSTGDRSAQIVDLAERKIFDLDRRNKTYEVTTFEEFRKQMEEMRQRAREQAPPDARGGQPPGDGQPAKQVEVDVDVQRPGDVRTINGHDTALTVTTITVHEKGRTLEESGGIVMTARTWVADEDIGTKEVLDFQRRYAEALGEVLGLNASAEQLTSATGMFPGLGEAIKTFQEAGVEMAGAAILTETTFENVRGQSQLTQAPPEEEPRRRWGFGGLGGLGSQIGRALGGGGNDPASGDPRSTIFTATNELLEVDPNPDASVAIPADFKEK